MEYPRLLLQADRIGADLIAGLTPDEAHYLSRVLRLGPGGELEVFDGHGRVAKAVLLAGFRVQLDEPLRTSSTEPLAGVEIMVAPSKGKRMDWLVEKASEVGVIALQPLKAERSVADPQPLGERVERWRRLAQEAARQSGRASLMTILPPLTPAQAAKDCSSTIKVLLDFRGKDLVGPFGQGPIPEKTTVSIMIGPEGGFTAQEVSMARKAGFAPVSLGPRTLRVETAALVAASLALHLLGEMKARP